MNNNFDVFLCYRDTGGILAHNIYSDLSNYSKNKLKIFFAPKCIKHGENFMETCKEVASKVSLMILILTPDFFDGCLDDGDTVYCELKSALSNPDCSFLPILTQSFTFNPSILKKIFSEQEIDRIRYINAIKYIDEYSFDSVEMLLPILKEKVGLTDYNEMIVEQLTQKREKAKKRVHIEEQGKKGFFSQDNLFETRRLYTQQNLLYNFDMPVYEKYLHGKKNLNVLDIGCGTGAALMSRLGNRDEISKIVGIEYDASFVEKAIADYENENVHFYKIDVESFDFIEKLEKIMSDLQIESFDWINVLAVMSHLKNPYQLLKNLKKICKKDSVIFIRNIDDGLNFVYPDEKMYFQRAFDMISKCDTTGFRYSGRELYTLLSRANYRDIVYERVGINSSVMNYDEKEELFNTIFDFLRNGINATVNNNPHNHEMIIEKQWLDDVFSELEQKFLSSDTLVNFGFLIVVAKM